MKAAFCLFPEKVKYKMDESSRKKTVKFDSKRIRTLMKWSLKIRFTLNWKLTQNKFYE